MIKGRLLYFLVQVNFHIFHWLIYFCCYCITISNISLSRQLVYIKPKAILFEFNTTAYHFTFLQPTNTVARIKRIVVAVRAHQDGLITALKATVLGYAGVCIVCCRYQLERIVMLVWLSYVAHFAAMWHLTVPHGVQFFVCFCLFALWSVQSADIKFELLFLIK